MTGKYRRRSRRTAGGTWLLGLFLLALAGIDFSPAAAQSDGKVAPVNHFQVWGAYQIPNDSGFKDIYSGAPGLGAAYFLPATRWGGIEFAAAYHWASGNPIAGPFVQKAEVGFRSLPISVGFRFDPSPNPIRPYGRVGIVVQWSQEAFDVEAVDLKVDESASQWSYGVAVGCGFLSSGRKFNIFSDLQWSWLPADQVEIIEGETRKIDDMDLGGIQFRLGVAF